MTNKIKRGHILPPLLLLVLLACLCSCREKQAGSGSAELWVVTDKTDIYGMNGQASRLISRFETDYPGITVRLDILPAENTEREVYLEQLRTQILAGKGPDVYLLPVNTYSPDEQLFKDVARCMHNGIFADISEYYDADDDLGKDSLIAAVMDAGVVDGARYVLPLRFDLPVLYVDQTQAKKLGLEKESLTSGIAGLMQTALENGDAKLACGISSPVDWYYVFYVTNFFSDLIDYENQQVLLTDEALSVFMDQYQKTTALIGKPASLTPYFDSYCQSEKFWATSGYCAYIGPLADAPLNAAIAKAANVDLAMYPVAALDGGVVADVTYYGAVGAGCEHADIAYDFLRLFLTQSAQWEEDRYAAPNRLHPALIASGWPVRAKGCAGKLWDVLCAQQSEYSYERYPGGNSRKTKLIQTDLTDDDLPILQATISKARFSITAEANLAGILLTQLNDPANGYTPTDTDLDALAQEFIREFEWQVAES